MNKVYYVLAVCTFVGFCFLWATFETPFIQAFDNVASDLLYENQFITWFHYVGEKKFIFTVTIILLLLIWIRKKDYLLMAFVLFSVGGGYGLYQFLKRVIQRPRPEIADQFSSYSFPSGHALHGLVYLFAMVYVVTRIFNIERTSLIIWIMAILLTILIGLSVIAEVRHFASDVIAGWLLGYSLFILWCWWYNHAIRIFVRFRTNNTKT